MLEFFVNRGYIEQKYEGSSEEAYALGYSRYQCGI